MLLASKAIQLTVYPSRTAHYVIRGSDPPERAPDNSLIVIPDSSRSLHFRLIPQTVAGRVLLVPAHALVLSVCLTRNVAMSVSFTFF